MNDTTTSPDAGETDWAAWSREAVETMMARNAEWPRQFGLLAAPQYHWDLQNASLVLQGPLHAVQGTVCLVGTSSQSDGSFVWSWANASIPAQHGQALEMLRFGQGRVLLIRGLVSVDRLDQLALLLQLPALGQLLFRQCLFAHVSLSMQCGEQCNRGRSTAPG